MTKTFIVVLFSFFSIILFSQDKQGYFGAKQFVSIETLLFSPIFYNYSAKTSNYSKYNTSLNKSNDLLNYGFRFTYGYLTKRNIALCMETGIDFSNVYMRNYIENDNFNCDKLTISKLNIQSYSFLPKIEFSTKKGLLPLGFSHQVGIGFSLSKLMEKDYSMNAYDITGYDTSNDPIYTLNDSKTVQLKDNFFDYKNSSITTYTFLYALSMRTAITKKILLNYGFRYTLNLQLPENSNQLSTFNVQKNDIQELVNNQKSHNIITLNVGLTYAF